MYNHLSVKPYCLRKQLLKCANLLPNLLFLKINKFFRIAKRCAEKEKKFNGKSFFKKISRIQRDNSWCNLLVHQLMISCVPGIYRATFETSNYSLVSLCLQKPSIIAKILPWSVVQPVRFCGFFFIVNTVDARRCGGGSASIAPVDSSLFTSHVETILHAFCLAFGSLVESGHLHMHEGRAWNAV